ncbi:MAG: DHHW family protein [Oscillospiraceae bacterium]|nr:DHHW family protein [Oscillospiraceae bacterium]
MQNKFHRFNIAVFVLVLAVISPFLFLAPRTYISETERRELEQFPVFSWDNLFSGEYTRKIGIYFSDTVPMRENLTEASAIIKNMMGIRIDGVKLHNIIITEIPEPVPPTALTPQSENNKPANDAVNISPTPGTSDSTAVSESDIETGTASETDSYTPVWDGVIEDAVSAPDGVADIANNGILVYQNRGLMLYGGSYAQGSNYAAVLNSYRQRLSDDTKLYSMLIPTAVEFYCPSNYRSLSGDQRGNINHITSLLDPGITPINVYSALAAQISEEIFLRTDHHWAPLGAYYAAEEFAKTAGVPFTQLSDYEKVTVPGYVGTMYGYSGDIRIKNNPEDFVYYKPPNTYNTVYYNYDNPEVPIHAPLFITQGAGTSYSVFMGGDAKITHIFTDVENGRKVAVFKDSFGNALVPFLVGSFEEIIVIDIRYFPYSAIEYLQIHEVTDVLFANNIFAANTAGMINHLKDIMDVSEEF